MILSAPRDLSFPNGPECPKGTPVDVDELAAALGRTDVDALAADLIDQGWTEAPKKSAAAKKAAPKTSPAPADDNTPDEGGKEKP